MVVPPAEVLQRPGAMDPRQQRGLAFAQANCARCHAIDKTSASPLKLALPFRELHKLYPVESLEEALGEGNMPEFRLDPGQVGDQLSQIARTLSENCAL